jgi:HPt (histidine-containing phosphotransfer) domain-containing protein
MNNIDIPYEMKKTYLDRRQKDFEDCKAAVDAHNFELIARVSHQLKGNASSFGFTDLSDIAIDLEKANQTKDTAEIQSVLKKFEIFLREVEI